MNLNNPAAHILEPVNCAEGTGETQRMRMCGDDVFVGSWVIVALIRHRCTSKSSVAYTGIADGLEAYAAQR